MKRFLIFLWLAIGLCCFCTGCGQQTSPEDTALQVTVLVKPGVEPSASSSSEASSDSDSSSSASSEEPDENTFVDEAGETVHYTDVITGECTAYSGDSVTALGITPEVGMVAVDPSVIPYGTQMLDGSALCDLFMDSEEECEAFGRQDMLIYLLEDELES